MKELNLMEIQCISGGDFNFDITLHVPSPIGWQFSYFFQALITGQTADTNGLVKSINDAITAGANMNQIRVQSITFTNMN